MSCKQPQRAFSKMADHFDEKSGVVPSKTSWGNWAQTIDEVFIEVNVPKGTKGREISCDIKPKSIKFCLKGQEYFKVTTQSIALFLFSTSTSFILPSLLYSVYNNILKIRL